MTRAGQALTLLCILTLVVTLCGCGGSGGVGSPGDETAGKPVKPPPLPPPPTPCKIAFMRSMTRGKEKGTWQIFTINTDGSGEQQLTSAAYSNASPSWAPDGRLAFTSNRTGRHLVYMMNSDGSGQTAVTSPPENRPGDAEPDCCPSDPNKIVFRRYREGTYLQSDLWMVDGGNETQLTQSPTRDGWPSFSPDGQFIVFNRMETEGETGQLCVVPATGGAALPLQWGSTVVEGTYPDWSPDGTAITYYYYAEIWRMPVNPATGEATGPSVPLTSDGTAIYERHPTWSPLQDHITYWYWSDAGDHIVTRELATGVVSDLTSGQYPDWSPAVFGS